MLDSEVPHHDVLRVAMDAEDEDDDQSLVDFLERDLTLQDQTLKVWKFYSTRSQAPDDSEREDNCSEAGSEVLPPTEVEPDPPLMRPSAAAMRVGLPLLDGEDLSQMFSHCAAVMKAVPKFLWGSFHIAFKLALEEVAAGSAANDRLRQERGWKLFLVLPHMLLHRFPRGKEKLLARFEKFAAGQWTDLLRASDLCSEQAAREDGRSLDLTSMCLGLFIWCNCSSGRQALEGADLAPGTTATLNALRDPTKRPQTCEDVPRIPPHRPFELDEMLFSRNFRKQGAAGGPPGMTFEHLRPLLDSPRDNRVLFRVADLVVRGELPPVNYGCHPSWQVDGPPLRKSNGGVRGIVAGEVIRRLVARMVAQQLGPVVKAATSPFQFALFTKSGCECVAIASKP